MALCVCGKPARPRQRDCRECHAASMRASRARRAALQSKIAYHLTMANEALAELRQKRR